MTTDAPRSRRLLGALALAAAYLICGKLSLLLAIPPGYATAVWPPAGIALAALLVYGRALWPGIVVGSFLVNVGTSFDATSAWTIAKSIGMAAGIGAGASFQAVGGEILVRRFVSRPLELVREGDILRFLILGGPAACLVNATVSVTLLLAAGVLTPSQVAFNWWTWWVGDSIGVAVVAPFALVWIGQPRDVWRRRRFAVNGVLATTFAVVVLFFVRASAWESARIESGFRSQAQAVAGAIERELAQSLEVLYAVEGFHRSSDDVRPDEFRTFVTPLIARHRALQAISWNRRVVANERAAVEGTAHTGGSSDFRFTERDAAGRLVAAAQRDEYVVVTYIEPIAGNVAALGFDVASEPVRAEALRRAEASRGLAMTGGIRLVQETGRQAGILAFLPVYAGGGHADAASRPWGYVTGVFRVGDIVGAALRDVPRAGIVTRVRDDETAAADGLLHAEDAGVDDVAQHRRELCHHVKFDVAGRTWSVECRAAPAYLAMAGTWRAWTVLATGLLLVAILGALSLSMTGRAVVIERIGRERAAELSKANDVLLREISEREMAQATLRELVESTSDGVVLADESGNIVGWNRGAEATFGYAAQEIRGRPLHSLMPERYRDAHKAGIERFLFSGEKRVVGRTVQVHGRRKDGSEFPIDLSVSTWTASGRRHYGAILRDTTARTEMEAALRQSHKMDAIGQLAGGVAHDFNNLLTVISGYGAMALSKEGLPVGTRPCLENIVSAAQRAAGLTRQLLAFGRKQMLQPEILDVNDVLAAMERMLRPLIGEDIDVCLTLSPEVGWIHADRGQIEQVVLNVVVNARDAMPDGGKLTIGTHTAEIDDAHAANEPGVAAGRYVVVSVSDTGIGMDDTTRARIFEPFFTTKEAGKGTGLGLATVYGIVKQSGGHVEVESAPGRGSCFRVFLPRAEVQPRQRDAAPAVEIPRGGETILLVEDDESVRVFAADVLSSSGYCILSAPTPREALAIAGSSPRPIDIVLTDVVMPGMNGRQLVDALRARGADVTVLYTSGYSDTAIVRHGVLEPGIAFLAKPFSPAALLCKVREELDGRKRRSDARTTDLDSGRANVLPTAVT